jgi:DNA primase
VSPTLKKILDRIDIVELVSERVPLTRRGDDDLWGICVCSASKAATLHVRPSKRLFKSFCCGAGGDAFQFVQLSQGVTLGRSVEILAERTGVDLDG